MTQKTQKGTDTDTETMAAIGLGLYGDRWIPKMAASLGAFHPRQRSVSASYISAIHAGRKPCPAWIRDALPQAIAYEISVRQDFQRQLKERNF
jgi:hypothetical protein